MLPNAVLCADTLWMNNGDVLTGDIVALKDGVLSLKTPYAGIIKLDWRFVKTLDSGKQFWISLTGEKEVRLRRIQSQSDGLTLLDNDNQESFFTTIGSVATIHIKRPVRTDTWKLSGNLATTLDSKTGNNDEFMIGLQGKLKVDQHLNKNAIYWDVEIENDDGVKSSEWVIGYSYSRYFDEHWFVQSTAEKEYDSEEDLTTRTSLGGTLGYRFWETPGEAFKVSGGISQLWEKYESHDSKQDYALTWAFNYRTRLNQRLEYFANNKTLFRMDKFMAQVNLNQGIKVGLAKQVTWNLTHIMDYESDPADNKQNTDSQVKMGIGYQW